MAVKVWAESETYCDECGRGMCGEDTVCYKCVEQLKDEISALKSEIRSLEHDKEQLQKIIDEWESEES